MEGNARWALLACIAPLMWGSTYFVIAHYLPAGHPLWGAVFRALPAGLILLAMSRKLPRGSWWWRSALLGTLNMGAFFALVYVSGQLLPSSIAAMVMSLSPIMLMLLAWGMLSERPAVPLALGGVVGVAGSCCWSVAVGISMGSELPHRWPRWL